jgi:hypothetical protein
MTINGVDVASLAVRDWFSRNCGYVAQVRWRSLRTSGALTRGAPTQHYTAYFSDLTVRENLYYAAELRLTVSAAANACAPEALPCSPLAAQNLPAHVRRRRAAEAMAVVGLSDVRCPQPCAYRARLYVRACS